MTDQVVSPELNFRPATYTHGTKTYTQLFQQTGGTNLTIPVANIVETKFEIPTKAFDLSESFIRGQVTLTAGGGALFNWWHAHTPLISEIYLMTRGGQYMAQLPNVDKYRVMTRGWNTSFTDFTTSDETEFYAPSREAGTTANIGGRHVAPIPAAAPYTELQYLQAGTAVAQANTFPFMVKLGDFNDTIFALRKSLMFPEVIILRIVWGPAQRMQFRATGGVDPVLGGAIPAGPIIITNLSMFLAVEQNQSVENDLRTLNNSGIEMAIPFVHSVFTQSQVSNRQSISTKITTDMGFAVKRIVYAPFNVEETKETAYDHDNRNGAKIITYQTQLNSVQQQQFIIDCSVSMWDDWKLQQRFMKGTAIQNRDIFQYNWVHIEDFSDLPLSRLEDLRPANKDNIVSGLPIIGAPGGEHIWTLAATSANAIFNHYIFIVAYKTLVIKGSSVMVQPYAPTK